MSKKQFSPAGLLVGLLLVILGAALIFLGLSGDFTLFSELSGFNGEEIDALGGALFVIIGLIVMWVTRRAAE